MRGIIWQFASKQNKNIQVQRLLYFLKKLQKKSRELISIPVDFSMYLLNFPDKSLFVAEPQNYFLFYGSTINFRIKKLINRLEDNQKNTIVLVDKYTPQPIVSIKGETIKIRNAYHAKRLFKNTNIPHLIYFAADARFCAKGIEDYPFKKIFDNYDNYITYYGYDYTSNYYYFKGLLQSEKKCFEQADIVLARNIETQVAIKMYGLGHKKKFFYPDTCDKTKFIENKKTISADAIHLVYCGGLYGSDAHQYTHGFDDFSMLYDSLERNNIIVHLYPNLAQNIIHYKSIIELSKSNKFVQVHKSVQNDNLVATINQYHFGMIPHFKHNESSINSIKLKYATSNKFFNYLEAGLPIIITDEMEFMAWIVKRYNIGIVINKKDFNDLNTIIRSYDYRILCNNVQIIREKFIFEKQFNNLLKQIC